MEQDRLPIDAARAVLTALGVPTAVERAEALSAAAGRLCAATRRLSDAAPRVDDPARFLAALRAARPADEA